MPVLDVSFTIDVPYAEEEALNCIRMAFTRRDVLEELGLSMRGSGYYRSYRQRGGPFYVQWHLTEGIIIRMDLEINATAQQAAVMGRAYLKQPTLASIAMSAIIISAIFLIIGSPQFAGMAWIGALVFILLFQYQSSKLVGRLRRALRE